jgi:hypothetical protein
LGLRLLGLRLLGLRLLGLRLLGLRLQKTRAIGNSGGRTLTTLLMWMNRLVLRLLLRISPLRHFLGGLHLEYGASTTLLLLLLPLLTWLLLPLLLLRV